MSTPIRTPKGTTGSNSATSRTISNLALTDGSTLVVAVMFASTMSVASLRWGVYDLVLASSTLIVGSDSVLAVYLLKNAPGGTADLVLTLSGGPSFCSMLASGWEDVDPGAPLDAIAGTTGTGNSISSGLTPATVQKDEALTGHALTRVGIPEMDGGETFAWTGALTTGQQATVNVGGNLSYRLRESYKILTATGVQSVTATVLNTPDWGAIAATLKATAAQPRRATLRAGTRNATLITERA